MEKHRGEYEAKKAVLLSWEEPVAEEAQGAERRLSAAEFQDILRQLSLRGA